MQTALAESITQVLPEKRIGVGMGFFNKMSKLSGAVVTALVAKSIEKELFAFKLHPLLSNASAYIYGRSTLQDGSNPVSTYCLTTHP